MKELAYKIETDSQTSRTSLWWQGGRMEGKGSQRVQDGHVHMLYLEWIINKDLLDSTWNSVQCYMTAWMGAGLQENGYM